MMLGPLIDVLIGRVLWQARVTRAVRWFLGDVPGCCPLCMAPARGAASGRVAFDAYREARGGRNHDGTPTPTWEQLTDGIRAGWDAAASAISDGCNHPYHEEELEFALERERRLEEELELALERERRLEEELEDRDA